MKNTKNNVTLYICWDDRLKIWLILDFGIENFKKTLINRIIIKGRGARKMDKYE